MQTNHEQSGRYVDEMLAGFVKCHSDIVKIGQNRRRKSKRRCSRSGAEPIADKVGIVTGAALGINRPLSVMSEKNMCDAAAVVGEICSPGSAGFPGGFPRR